MGRRLSRGISSGVGSPRNIEGRNGDLSIRKTRQGKIFYIKADNEWHAINTGIDTIKLKKDVDRLLRGLDFLDNSFNSKNNIHPTYETIHLNKAGKAATIDPKIKFSIGGADKFVMGVDDSDSDKFKLDTAGTIGGATKLTMDSSGNVDLSASNLKLGTGSTGVLLKNNSGVLQVRNVGDSADAIIKAKRLQVDAGTSGTSGAVTGEIQFDSGDSILFAHGTGLFVSNFITGSSYVFSSFHPIAVNPLVPPSGCLS